MDVVFGSKVKTLLATVKYVSYKANCQKNGYFTESESNVLRIKAKDEKGYTADISKVL